YSLTTFNDTDSEITKYITLGPAAELQVNDKLTIGGMLGIILGEKEYGDSTVRSWYSDADFGWWYDSYGAGAWRNSTCTYHRVNTDGLTGKPEGTGLGLKGVVKYDMSDDLSLRGIFDYQSISLSGNVTTPEVDNLINNGSDGSTKTDSTRSGDKTIETNNIALGAGFENQMNKDLMLAMAIKYSVEEEQTDYSRDGVYRANDVPVSYLSNIQDMEKDTVTNLILPIGMEYKANKWMTLRMGASHKITTTESEDRTTTTSYAATYPVKTVTTIVTIVDPKSTTVVRDTDYSFGAGFQVTDNLQIDLLNFTNLTDMSFWKLSATLKFYGNSETASGRSSKINTSDGAELKKKYWTKAVREYNKANYEKAISYWEKILDIDPGHKASLQRIEQAQKMMRNYE
ncbi:outer membrane protein transport protein, partial [bacterium]|nr:outer membrane protein transport protein [bacterium]